MRLRYALLLVVCGTVVVAFDVWRAPPADPLDEGATDADTIEDHAAGHVDDEDDCDHGAHPAMPDSPVESNR
jgi:hypothetical protein